MKKFFCLFALLFSIPGMGQAAGDTYNLATETLDLQLLNLSGSGDFCNVSAHLGFDGKWDLLAATACMPLRAADNNYDPDTEILSIPRLTVIGAGDFCKVRVRLGLYDQRWELRTFETCSTPIEPGSCQPASSRFDQIQVGMDFETGYGTGTTLEQAASIMGCPPLHTTDAVQCGETENGTTILCELAVWQGTDNKELAVLFSYDGGAVTKSGYGFWYLPDGQVIPYTSTSSKTK